MKIRVDHIKDSPCQLQVDEPVGIFPVLSGLQSDGVCDFLGNVTAGITVEREFDHLKAVGRVQVPVELTCSRCLVKYRTAVDSAFTIILRRESSRHTDVEEEIELCDDDLISMVYSGDEIDLSGEIEEQVAIEIPIKPLCSDDCLGLCSECGTDLNKGVCSCSDNRINLKFSALKDFKVSR